MKHDRLLSNRMLGGYYQRLAAEANKPNSKRQPQLFQLNGNEVHPQQFGGALSNPTTTQGHILGIYDTKIQVSIVLSCLLAKSLSSLSAPSLRPLLRSKISI